MIDPNYTHKIRAVFLAALMVFSILAGTVAFTGTTSAAAANLDLGSGDGTDHSVDQGTTLENIQVDDDNPDNATLFVFIDENGNGAYDSGEATAINESSYDGAASNVNIGDISTDGLSAGTYAVYAYENESLNDGDDSFDTSVQLTLDETAGATNLDLGSGDGTAHTVDRGTTLENVQVDDDTPNNATLFVFIDENDNEAYDSGEAFAINESSYIPEEENVEIGDLETDDLSTGTYDVYAYENESLNDGDDSFDTSVQLTLERIADPSNYDTDVFFDDYDALTDEQLLWGQEIAVAGFDSGETVVLYEDEGDSTRTAEQFVADANGVITFDSSELEQGDYFINDRSNNQFEVLPQTLDVAFQENTVRSDESVDLEFDSNRGTYDVYVSADGLDASELADQFNSGDFEGIEEDSDDDRITLEGVRDGTVSVDFTDIENDEYTYEFNVTDTSASDSDTIEVTERDVDADFSESTYIQTAGDIVEISVELEDTDSAFVQFGDENAGFVDVLYIEDNDDDDEVTFQVNTRMLGTTAPYDAVYHSEDDIVESEIHGGISTPDPEPSFEDEDGDPLTASGADDGSFEAYLDELNLIDADSENASQQLIRPPQPTSYDLALGGDNTFIVTDDGESELNDELDLAVLDLTRPSVQNLQTLVAPSDTADEDDELQELREVVTEQTEIAEDDRLIIKAEASGIYGHMVAIDSDHFDALDEGFSASTLDELVNNRDGEGVNFEVEADDAVANQEPTELNLGGSGVDSQDIFILADNEAGELYIVVDTSSSDAFTNDIDTGTDFSVELEYETDPDERFEFDSSGRFGNAGGSDSGSDAAFPYFQPDNTQTETTEFEIVDPEVTFDNQNEDGIIEIAIGGITGESEGTVSGVTNIAPGSEATLHVRSDSSVSSSFLKREEIEITSDGTFSTTFDFSDHSAGDTGEASLRLGGSTVGSNDVVLVDQLTPTPEETPIPTTETPEPTTETDTPEPTTDTPETTTEIPTVTTPTTTPGFSVVAAVLALLAATLLAIRRE